MEQRINDSAGNQPGQHLIDIDSLNQGQLHDLIGLSMRLANDPDSYTGMLSGKLMINLFLEPSTRTRVSFEIAAKRLGMQVINFQPESSSVVKGEALEDTFDTLQAMAPDVIVIRHADDGVPRRLSERANTHTHLINAGEGSSHHPTQALLDAVTLAQTCCAGSMSGFANLTVTVVGDIKHSRVARSGITILQKHYS